MHKSIAFKFHTQLTFLLGWKNFCLCVHNTFSMYVYNLHFNFQYKSLYLYATF